MMASGAHDTQFALRHSAEFADPLQPCAAQRWSTQIMPAIRIALIGIGVGLWVPLAIIVGCRGGMCGHAWDSPPGSLRYQLYALLAAHRGLVAATFFAYGVATIVAFRREVIAAVTTVAVLRVLGLIAVAIALVGVGVLLTLL